MKDWHAEHKVRCRQLQRANSHVDELFALSREPLSLSEVTRLCQAFNTYLEAKACTHRGFFRCMAVLNRMYGSNGVHKQHALACLEVAGSMSEACHRWAEQHPERLVASLANTTANKDRGGRRAQKSGGKSEAGGKSLASGSSRGEEEEGEELLSSLREMSDLTALLRGVNHIKPIVSHITYTSKAANSSSSSLDVQDASAPLPSHGPSVTVGGGSLGRHRRAGQGGDDDDDVPWSTLFPEACRMAVNEQWLDIIRLLEASVPERVRCGVLKLEPTLEALGVLFQLALAYTELHRHEQVGPRGDSHCSLAPQLMECCFCIHWLRRAQAVCLQLTPPSPPFSSSLGGRLAGYGDGTLLRSGRAAAAGGAAGAGGP